jgi:hypothetical protein
VKIAMTGRFFMTAMMLLASLATAMVYGRAVRRRRSPALTGALPGCSSACTRR